MKHAAPGWRLFLALSLLFPSLASAELTDPLLRQTVAAIHNWDFKQVRQTLDDQGALATADVHDLNGPRIISITSCRQFVRFFSAISSPTPEQRETLA